jgi:thioesterase domain-containing protein
VPLQEKAVRPHGLAALFFFCLLALLAGCANGHPFESRSGHAARLAQARGWIGFATTGAEFPLSGFRSPQARGSEGLRVYLEGDGYAWSSLTLPSTDPTPRNPVALRLALADPKATHYLARPCQFSGLAASACDAKYWTSARFAPELVRAVSQALDEIQRENPSRPLHLIGYSGGGVMAALIAAQRQDIASLTTVAAPLDIDLWTAHHQVAPLRQSLSPMDFAQRLRCLAQTHHVGAKDKIVPARVVESYLRQLEAAQTASSAGPGPACPGALGKGPLWQMEIHPDQDHEGGWDEIWRTLMSRPLPSGG